MPVIYKITSPSGRIYIGQSWNVDKRFLHYRNYRCKGQTILHRSFKKYGARFHIFEVIHELPEDVNQKVLDQYEFLYWDLYRNCGIEMLNAKEPGRSGGRHSDETKKLIAQKSIGNCNAKGRSHTIEARKKISDKQLGVCWTEERKKRAKGKKKKLKGPRIKDRTIYTFINLKTGETFTGIRHDFKVKFNLRQESVHRLVVGEYKQTGNWILAKHNAGDFIPGTQYVNL